MSSLMIYCWLWIMFIVKQECSVIRLDQGKRMKDGIEFVMSKYLNPLRKLTADLPNHAIEMQIEIHDSIPSGPPVTQKPQRRLIRVINARRPKSNAAKRQGADQTTTDAAEETVAPALGESPPPLPPQPADPLKLPVYMDDLKRALDDLEKKIINQGTPPPATLSTILARKQVPCNGGNNSPRYTEPAVSNSPPFRNIDDIMQLLKKAIHVERRVSKPLDENLEWVQIKIPKNV